MRTIKIMTVLTMVIMSAILCLAQFSPKKPAAFYRNCQQTASAASISEAEDFSLISLLTLKFM